MKKGLSEFELRTQLEQKGFSEREIARKLKIKKNPKLKKFLFKESFDRVGFGFANMQFVNILFYQVGMSLFLIGIFNGLRALITSILSGFFKEKESLNNQIVARLGIFYGFIFVFMGLARFYGFKWLYGILFLLGGVGIVYYGDFYHKILKNNLNYSDRSYLLKRVLYFGIFITLISLFLSAFLFQYVSMPIPGYLISFQIAAVMFILSGYVLSFFKVKTSEDFFKFKDYYVRLKVHLNQFFKDRVVRMLIVGNSITSLVQVVGFSYYGIFIYELFFDSFLKGFVNVAAVFSLAVVFSIIGPYVARILSVKYGEVPVLVFGTILMAIMPLTFFYNPNLVSISMGVIAGVIGSSANGVATGLLVRRRIRVLHRKSYYSTFSVIVTLPFIITVPILTYLVRVFDIRLLFFVLGVMLLLFVAPVYFFGLFKKI